MQKYYVTVTNTIVKRVGNKNIADAFYNQWWTKGISTCSTYPMMNFILPLRAVSTRIGTSCGSRGPKMPWGRMAAVRKPFSLSQASSTSWSKEARGKKESQAQVFTMPKLIMVAALWPFPAQFWSLYSSRWASWHKAGPLSHSLYLCLQTPHWRCWSGPVSARVKQQKSLCAGFGLLWGKIKKTGATHLWRPPHLHSSLQTRLNDRARALNVDPLKQCAVVTGWGWWGTVKDQRHIPQGWQQSLEDHGGGN